MVGNRVDSQQKILLESERVTSYVFSEQNFYAICPRRVMDKLLYGVDSILRLQQQ